MFSTRTYIDRRKRLQKDVASGILLFLGNDDYGMNYADNTYHFRQDSTFLYFFGSDYAGLSAIIDIDNDKEIIFGDELTIDHIVWMGTQPTVREKSLQVGVNRTEPSSRLPELLSEAIRKGRKIHFLPPYRAEHQVKLMDLLGVALGKQAEAASVDFIKAVVNQRNYKTDEEILQIEDAVNITADMHNHAMRMARPGMKEAEVAAAVTEIALAHEGELSFPVIATINGQTLHNHYHGNVLKEGDMLLLDAGAENRMHYAGDLSSTIPVGKRFTERQKDIYRIALAAHQNAVEALRPGVPFKDIHLLAARTIVDGMKNLGLMRGDAAEAANAGAHALFFQCGLGHMMGLDVHDMENLGEVWVGYDGQPKSTLFGLKSLRLARKLEPGFVLTIEPGIYFIPELIDMWKAEKRFAEFINYDKVEEYRNFGGLRNEEDYLITQEGARRLGKHVPIAIEDVESMR
jgi:Xaa-Pro aminopeptidase